MTQQQAERLIRGLQKEFLTRVEAHPKLESLDPMTFNNLRKRVFRGTFQAYRLGVVGIENQQAPLFSFFFGWLEDATEIQQLEPNVRVEVTEMCFRTALEAYRIGAMVAVQRKTDDSPYAE